MSRIAPCKRMRRFALEPLGDIELAEITNLMRDGPFYGPMIVGLLLLAIFIVWPHVPPGFAIGFVVLLAIETTLKLASALGFKRSAPAARRAPVWRLIVCGGAAYAGIFYGLVSLVLLRPLPLDALLPLVCIQAALVALAVWGMPHYWRANLALSIPLSAPLVIALLASGEAHSIALALLIALIVVMGLRVSHGISARLTTLIVTNAENEALRARAEQAVIDKSRFMAAASHDLRQPLHALGLFQHALRSNCKNPGDARLIDSIGRSSAQLRALLDALLDISRLDARAIEPRLENVALELSLRTLRDEFSAQASGKGLALHVAVTDAVVRTDPLLLVRVLRNLLSNAIKFSDRGTVSLTVAHTTSTDVVTICVEDNGPGIAEDERRHVFTEFYRVESGAMAHPGVGLGLAIVSRLCTLLGVALTLDTGVGKGTRVELRVPAGEPALMVAPVVTKVHARSLDGLAVLVVDDDATTLEGLRATLEAWGCTVRGVVSVVEAIAPLRPDAATPALLLYDARVSVRNDASGPDGLVHTVRARLGRAVPAIVIGWSREVADSWVPVVDVEHLVKPVAPLELRRAVERLTSSG